MTIERDMIDWCKSFKASRQWLNAVREDRSGSLHTQKSYANALKVFSDWTGKNPDQLVAEKREQMKNLESEPETENKLRDFCTWLKEEKKLSRTTIGTRFHAPIKSFFKHNKAALELPTYKFVAKERKPHTLEEIRALLQIADVREKSIIMLLKDSGISREDAIKLKYEDIQADYETNKDTIHIALIRTKESVKYDTFLGKNAIEALRAYLEYRKRRGETITKDSYLIAQINGKPTTPENLSQMFVRLGKKAGFYTSPHRLRKFFMSRLGLVVPTILVRFWIGHSLGVETAYFLPDIEKQRQQYREAYKEIDVFKSEVSALEMRKQNWLDTARILNPNLTDEQINGLKNIMAKVKSEKEFEDIRRKGISNVMTFIGRKEPDCENGNCQKIVEEQELSRYIEHGWKFVSVLPSGKIVISDK